MLTDLFHLEVESDNPDIHQNYAILATQLIQRMRKSAKAGRGYQSSLIPHVWSTHSENGCQTCDMVEKRDDLGIRYALEGV